MPNPQIYYATPGQKLTFDDLSPGDWPYYIIIGNETLKTMPEKYKDNKGNLKVKIWARIPEKSHKEPIYIKDARGKRRVGTILET